MKKDVYDLVQTYVSPYESITFSDLEHVYNKGWSACKQEVLKIIQEHQSENCDPFEPTPEYIKKIKEL